MKGLKKVLVFTALVSLAVPAASSCGVAKVVKCIGKEKLDVFNWGSYIDPAVIEAFEAENDVCVNYSTFDSNETAVEKLKKNEVYDVIFPSEYAIEQLISEDLIATIDWSKITSISNSLDEEVDGTNHLVSGLKGMINSLKNANSSVDFLNYTVPYFWGTVGIVYDTTVVPLSQIEEKQWDILKDNTYTVGYYNSSRDGFMIPLKELGYSVNTTNSSEVDDAKAWLIDQKKTLGSKLSYVGDDVIEDMASESNRYDMAVVYSGDATYMMQENEKLSYYKPTIGTNVWVDGMVIHKEAKNVELAYKFINFMMEDENAEANSLYVGYSSVKANIYEKLLNGDFVDQSASYEITFDKEKDEMFRYNPTSKKLIDDAWADVKLA